MSYSKTQNITYYANGIIESILNYNGDYTKGGQLNGTCIRFYDNGGIKLQSNYDEGRLQGRQRYYYRGNSIAVISNYNKGVMCGELSTFDCNGKLTSYRIIK